MFSMVIPSIMKKPLAFGPPAEYARCQMFEHKKGGLSAALLKSSLSSEEAS